MHGRPLARLLLVPCLLLTAAGCGAPATPAVKPSIKIVSPVTGSSLKIPSSQTSTDLTIRFSVSHFTLANSATTAQPGSGEIRLYENGKLWNILFSNSIKLSLAPGSYRFTAELTTNSKGQVVATSAPVVVSVSAAKVASSSTPTTVSVTLPSWCNTRTSLSSPGQPASTVPVRLTCLPNGDQIFHVSSPHDFFYTPDSSGNLWFVVAPPFGLTGGSNAPLGVGRITPAGTYSLFTKGLSPSSLGGGVNCPYPLTPGPGGMWFSCSGAIGRISPSGGITLFTKGLPASTTSVNDLTLGPGGDMWFVGYGSDNTSFVGNITPSGTISAFTKGPYPSAYCATSASCSLNDLTLGPDGDIWFRGYASNNTSFIGKISRSATTALVTQGLQQMCPDWAQSCLHPGPGGNMLFYIGSGVAMASTGFDLITPSGTVTRFTNDLYPSTPCSPQTIGCAVGNLTVAPGGDIWLTGSGPNHGSFIDRISPSGTVTRFTRGLPASTSFFSNFVAGPSGSMWFVGQRSGSNSSSFIGKISPSGEITLVTKDLCPTASGSTPASCFVSHLTLGPGGNIWLVVQGIPTSFIDRISPSGVVSSFSPGLPDLHSLVLGPTGILSFWGATNSRTNPLEFFGQISPSTTTTALP